MKEILARYRVGYKLTTHSSHTVKITIDRILEEHIFLALYRELNQQSTQKIILVEKQHAEDN